MSDGSPVIIKVSPPAGDSAYELAVKEGFEGTLEDWLFSLRATQGELWDELFVPIAVGLFNTLPAEAKGWLEE